jgi:hypothetical protein
VNKSGDGNSDKIKKHLWKMFTFGIELSNFQRIGRYPMTLMLLHGHRPNNQKKKNLDNGS